MTDTASDIRERILSRLSDEPGRFFSGEAISHEMGMTRAAVWKHMHALKLSGWPLDCVTRKGYRIPFDRVLPFSAAGIRIAMGKDGTGGFNRNQFKMKNDDTDEDATNGKSIIWKITVLEQTDSTSSRLKELAVAGAPEGTALFAEEQLGGRGRLGRSWSSQRGMGIWMSVLLRPDMAPDQVQSITLAVSVAVVETLRAVVLEILGGADPSRAECLAGSIGIKWPNDILWEGKKICGILTELAAEPEKLSHVVIGIGINVFQTEDDFPPELRSIASSLRMMLSAGIQAELVSNAGMVSNEGMVAGIRETEYLPDRNRLAGLLLRNLSVLMGEYRRLGMPEILKRWRSASVTLDRDICVMDPVNPWNAHAVDVGEDGRLLVERPDGTRTYLLSGEISIR